MVPVHRIPGDAGIEPLGLKPKLGIVLRRHVAKLAIGVARVGDDPLAVHGVDKPAEFVVLRAVRKVAGHDDEIDGVCNAVLVRIAIVDYTNRSVQRLRLIGLLRPPGGVRERRRAHRTIRALVIHDMHVGNLRNAQPVHAARGGRDRVAGLLRAARQHRQANRRDEPSHCGPATSELGSILHDSCHLVWVRSMMSHQFRAVRVREHDSPRNGYLQTSWVKA